MAEWEVHEELSEEELTAWRAAHGGVWLAGDPSQGQSSNLGPDPSSNVGNAGVTAKHIPGEKGGKIG